MRNLSFEEINNNDMQLIIPNKYYIKNSRIGRRNESNEIESDFYIIKSFFRLKDDLIFIKESTNKIEGKENIFYNVLKINNNDHLEGTENDKKIVYTRLT